MGAGAVKQGKSFLKPSSTVCFHHCFSLLLEEVKPGNLLTADVFLCCLCFMDEARLATVGRIALLHWGASWLP